ncbi:MAG: dicarboxylate/amino acid:cation symporter [Candidatus Margulisiibacteriota bacterium]
MKNLQLNIILSVILGVIAGFFATDYLTIYSFLGKTFITLLKYIVVPLVFASLISGIISLGSLSSLQKMGFKTLFYFVITTLVSSTIGILLAIGINPGKGFTLSYDSVSTSSSKALTFKEMFVQIIPNDFFSFISGGNMLFLILISILIGILIITFGRHLSFPIDELFEGFNEFMMIITNWVIAFSPIGIFGLVAQLIITTGVASFIPLIKYMLVVVLGLLIHACVIIPLLIKVFIKCSPLSVAKDIFTSLTTGFTTASSAATLPILLEDVRSKLKVPNKVASFVLPLGITINMDGTALFQAVAAVFIAQIYGVPLSLTSLGIIVFIAVLSSIGAAAVPSAGIITLAMILTAIGVPLEGTAIILGIDRILDMFRTTVNLWGNATASMIITKWLGESAYEN